MGSPKKIIQSVVHQMTTRSGAAASADPVVDTNNCPDPAGPSETSVAATANHDRTRKKMIKMKHEKNYIILLKKKTDLKLIKVCRLAL